MPSARDVQNRIRSVRNIAQITRALEAVSASRVRRAQERALASRNYSEKAWEILINVQSAIKGKIPHPLLAQREETKSVLVVIITSDRGLAGAYNSNILRVVQRFEERVGKPVKYLAVGRKGRDTLIRMGKDIIAEFSDLPANPSVSDVAPIARVAIDTFIQGDVDEVLLAYTDFINMLTQSPVVLGWLPLTPDSTANQAASEYVKEAPEVSEGVINYEYEPSAEGVLEEMVPRFTEIQLYQALLESQASEHAARMTAMHNATDNASGLVGDLTLEYNKARQAAITNEILDIVGGASALESSLKAMEKAKKAAQVKIASNGNGASKSTSVADGKKQTVATPKKSAPKAKSTPKKISPKQAAKADDLTKIEGIGKKMAQALINASIDTFAKLANSSEDTLRQAVEAAGMRLAPSLGTWAEQAQYAAQGDWDGLQAFQDTLVAGRRPDSKK
ncbi:MAG: ATP synthase F1 subunit gamma [Anaerolineae bacterium]|nr:ATP synthase F1 subunit gamma [Anaerolineae bacterium]